MNDKIKKIVAGGLVISMPAAVLLCEAKCSEACEEVRYVSLHAFESTVPTVDSTQITYLSAGTAGTTTMSVSSVDNG